MITNLSFTIHFPFNSNERQDYFIFNSNTSTAHLSRQNNTLTLFLRHDRKDIEYEIYKHNISTDFSFAWKDYMINNEKMTLVKYVGQIRTPYFNSYTFISPLLFEQYEYEEPGIPVFTCKEVNYGYIFSIIVLVLLIFQTKHLLPKIYKSLMSTELQDPVYVDIKTPVNNDSTNSFYE